MSIFIFQQSNLFYRIASKFFYDTLKQFLFLLKTKNSLESRKEDFAIVSCAFSYLVPTNRRGNCKSIIILDSFFDYISILIRFGQFSTNLLNCPQFNRITLGQHESDNNDRIIQLLDVFCLLFVYNGTSNF